MRWPCAKQATGALQERTMELALITVEAPVVWRQIRQPSGGTSLAGRYGLQQQVWKPSARQGVQRLQPVNGLVESRGHLLGLPFGTWRL